MRVETQRAFDNADYVERLLIALYVRDGWDRLWPWGQVPVWLWPRYNPDNYRDKQKKLTIYNPHPPRA